MKNSPAIIGIMIKLMMVLSFLGLSLHAYGGTHDGQTTPSVQTSANERPKEMGTGDLVEKLEDELGREIANTVSNSTAAAACLQEADCPYPARPVGEYQAN